MKVEFHERALSIVLDDQGEKKEVVSVGYYSVVLGDGQAERFGGTERKYVGFVFFQSSPSYHDHSSLPCWTPPLHVLALK